MGVVGWVAIAAAFVLLVGALRLGAQKPSSELKPVAPRVLPPTPARTAPSAALWEAARPATRNALNSWIAGAEVHGRVKGSAAVVEGDWLANPRVDLANALHGGLRQAGAPEDIASALAHEVAEGWKAWIRGYRTTSVNAFPGFAAWPAAQAPEAAAKIPGHPLRQGTSTADAALGAGLAAKLKARLPNEPAAAIDAFAAWLSGRLQAWVRDASLTDLHGKGPVPNFAPPYVPVGPVVGSLTGRITSPTAF